MATLDPNETPDLLEEAATREWVKFGQSRLLAAR